MSKFDEVENLSEMQILNLYEDVVTFGIDDELLGVTCKMYITCVDGRSSYKEANHGGCCHVERYNNYTTREIDCYAWHESFYAICGNCANYRSMYFNECP